MSSESIIFAAICWFCALMFGLIALWAFKRKTPMHFWSGSTVKPEEIKDIPAYNKENGMMWLKYTAAIVITGAVSLWSVVIGAILLIVVCVPGIAFLVISYKRIYNKYKND